MKHTQGEWKVKLWPDKDLGFVATSIETVPESNKFSICDVYGNNTKEQQANAKLIAAAPDLLNALNELRLKIGNLYPTDKRFRAEYKKAMAAIKKATE